MTKIRLIYLGVIIALIAFVVMYVDSLSIIFLGVALVLPVILFLILLLARLLTRIEVDLSGFVVTKGKAVSLKFNIKNYSFIALPVLNAQVEYSGAFGDEKEKTLLSFPLRMAINQASSFDITSNHVGVVKVYIGDIFFFDYFHLFKLKLKVRKSFEVTFLPEVIPVSMDIRPNTLVGVDSDTFSKSKKGDDPSEVFAIRDYVGGDKLNRIHWKLSSKQDTIMVKDYSLPINNNIVVMLELAAKGEDSLTQIDTVIETAIAISNCLCDGEIAHKLCWYDKNTTRFFKEEIKTFDDMYAALGMILNSTLGDESDSMAVWKKGQDVCSHLAYVSALPVAETVKGLGELSYATFYSVFCVGNANETVQTSGKIQFINVKNGKISDALSGFAL